MNYLYIFLIWLVTGTSSPNLTQSEIAEVVKVHNEWRSKVNVPPLVWDDGLAKTALKWAQQLKKEGCAFKHSRTKGLGENLFMGTSGYYSPTDVVNSWGEEIKDYNYKTNSCSGVCGHYTQVVWKTTKRVGCAKIECDGMDIWVCNYDPPGNWIGRKPY